MVDKINIRVYACVLQDKKVMVLHESYAGEKLIKFPGGGLEFGESVLDCLHREFAEELNLKINILSHLYTQEDFLVSRFRENEQLLTVYYLAEILDPENLKIMDSSIDEVKWMCLEEDHNPLPLPIDRIVFEKLKEEFL